MEWCEDPTITQILIHLSPKRRDVALTPAESISYLEEQLTHCNKDQMTNLLEYAMEFNNFTFEMIKMIIEAGADPRADNDTIFVKSCGRSDPRICSMFLELGADVNAEEGKALINSTDCNHHKVTKVLLEHGAKPNAAAIRNAIEGESFETIKLFLDNEVDPNTILKIYFKLFLMRGITSSSFLKTMLSDINNSEPDYFKIVGELCTEEEETNDDYE
jgi:hypothetical protein